MDVSHLRVKVDSEGIDKVNRQLGSMGRSAETAEGKVKKLTDVIDKLIGKNSQLASSHQSVASAVGMQSQAFGNMGTAMNAIAKTMQQIVNNANALTAAMGTLNSANNSTASSMARTAHWGGVVTSTLKAMATAAVAYAGVNLVKDVVKQADAWANMKAKLTIVTGSQHNANVAMADTFEIAQRVRVPLAEVTQLYTRLSPAMQRLGRTGQDVTTVVRGVSTALQLSGATGAEASSAMLQLSQAFNSGRLNGGEFNSIAEAAPLLLEALADHMKKPVGALKKLGSEGKITGKELSEALIAATGKWDVLFERMPLTFEGATIRIKNAWAKALGEMGQDTGFNQELVKALKILENMVPSIAQGLAGAFVGVMHWVEENRHAIGQIWEQVKALVNDVWDIAGAFGFVAKSVLGAGDEVNAFAFALFSARLFIAGIQDGFTALGGVVMITAGGISKYIGGALTYILTYPMAWLVDAVSGLWKMMASGAEMAGFKDMSARLRGLAAGADTVAGTLKNMGGAAVEAGDALQKKGQAAIAYLGSENNAVQRVLNSEIALANQRKKSVGEYDNSKNKPGSAPVADDKASKAAAKAQREFETHADKLNNALTEQLELQERLNQHGLEYDKISAGTKERIALEKKLHDQELSGASMLERTRTLGLLLIAKEVELQERLNERKLEGLKADKAEEDRVANKTKSLQEEAAQMEYKVATYDMAKGAIEEMELADARMQAALLQNMEARTPHEEKMLSLLLSQLDARQRLATAGGKLGELESAKEFDKLLDPRRAERFGNMLKDAFGKAGQALGKMVDAFNKYQAGEEKVAKLKKAYAGMDKTSEKAAEARAQIAIEEAQSTIGMYADMAAAAKGYFDEKSRGYKVLEAMEKAYRAFEMALELQSFAQKSGLLTAFTTAKVTADQTQAASAVSGAATEVGSKMAVAQANAISGVANQANGDPYSAFPRMAAMAAIMVGLGLAVAGNFSGGVAPETNKGTGTVLGDPEAQSKSLMNSIELLSEVDTMTMKYSAQMAISLRNIEASLAGVTNLVLRGNTTNTGSNYGIQEGVLSKNKGDPIFNAIGLPGLSLLNKTVTSLPIIGGLVSSLQGLWGKTKQEIVGAGLYAKGGLSYLTAGQGFYQYADVKTTKSSWFGLSKDTSYSTQSSALDAEMSKQFGMILGSFTDAVKAAAGPLGVSLDTIDSRLSNFVLDLGKIDLRGLTGDALKEKLEAVFGAAGDKIAKQALPGFEAFQQVGEGYLETVVRVSSGTEQAKYELDKLGIAMGTLASLGNKQGDVGAELVRQAIVFKEGGSGIGEIMQAITGSATDLADAYRSLVGIRNIMKAVGLGDNLNRDLIRAAGGLDALGDALKSYQDNFFSDAEKHAMQAQALSSEFAKLHVSMPATKEGFRALVEQLQGSGQTSLAVQVLLLADAFAEFTDSAAGSAQAVEDARSALSDAYEREKQALEDVKSKFEGFAKSLKAFGQNLLTGELSPLSNTEKYATLKAQYESTYSSAMSGDEDAIAKFESVASEFLQFSQEYNASGTQYTADFQRVLDATMALEEMTAGKASVAEQQLEALNKQVEGLLEVNESVLTVTQAIANLQAAIAAGNIAPPVTVDSGSDGTKGIPTTPDRSTALSVQVEELTKAVQEGNAATAAATSALIAATYGAAEMNANAVVAGTTDAVSSSAYINKVQHNLN